MATLAGCIVAAGSSKKSDEGKVGCGTCLKRGVACHWTEEEHKIYLLEQKAAKEAKDRGADKAKADGKKASDEEAEDRPAKRQKTTHVIRRARSKTLPTSHQKSVSPVPIPPRTIPPAKHPKAILEVVVTVPPRPRITEKRKYPSVEQSLSEMNDNLFHILGSLKSIEDNVAKYVDFALNKDQESSEESDSSEDSEVRPKKPTRPTSKTLSVRETEKSSAEEDEDEEANTGASSSAEEVGEDGSEEGEEDDRGREKKRKRGGNRR